MRALKGCAVLALAGTIGLAGHVSDKVAFRLIGSNQAQVSGVDCAAHGIGIGERVALMADNRGFF